MNRKVIRKQYRTSRTDPTFSRWYWVVDPGPNEKRWITFERAIYWATTGNYPGPRV